MVDNNDSALDKEEKSVLYVNELAGTRSYKTIYPFIKYDVMYEDSLVESAVRELLNPVPIIQYDHRWKSSPTFLLCLPENRAVLITRGID